MNPFVATGANGVKWLRWNKGAAHCNVAVSFIYLTGSDYMQRSANSWTRCIVNLSIAKHRSLSCGVKLRDFCVTV